MFLQRKPPKEFRPKYGVVRMLGVFAIAIYGFLAVVGTKRIEAAGWPVCTECERRRRRIRLTARWMFFGGLVLFVGPVLFAVLVGEHLPEPSESVAPFVTALFVVPPVLGFASMIVSARVSSRGDWPWITGGRVSQDGEWVVFDEPHPDFVAEIQPLLDGGGERRDT
ncbi:hypothetical protein [Haloechinothrix sp. LS1_15]|uniref:hypothetical protein n=1 Tax=Haloechinothrix sp. LS1_15 TaxID=2652248 RepID=UPI002947053A|nr:hypothetical protein [Haloechinothrix sp. LS1_15]MDV6012278.1 hypothetical protein [Haloechinothrix sp. LS1_15]